jgi:succinate dehydrogenase flavin-adding protein (antitoxin of CptAB toxin-antitoxin module)
MKNISLNIIFNDVLQKISFAEIEQMIQGNSPFRKFHCYCNRGILRGGNDAEIFAQDFITTYHPDYSKNTFKLILEMGTAKLIKIVNNEKKKENEKSNPTGAIAGNYA